MTFLNKFYIPHYNSFTIPVLFHEPYSLFITFLILLCVFFLKKNRTKKAAIVSIYFLVIVSIMLQLIGQWDYRASLVQQMSHKNFVQKKEILLGGAYVLSDCAQNKLKGRHYQGEFISILGSSSLVPSIFRYELYPVIDLASSSPQVQARVCYDSDQCSQVPDGYVLICQGAQGYIALRGGAIAQDHHSL